MIEEVIADRFGPFGQVPAIEALDIPREEAQMTVNDADTPSLVAGYGVSRR